MDEILLPQEEKAEESGTEFFLATVANKNSEGVTLIFDGQEDATQKRYKMLASLMPPLVGDRVVVMKQSGTYIVLGRIINNVYEYTYWTTASSVITASSGFTINEAAYYKTGRVGMLYVKATASSGSSSASWKTVGTVKTAMLPLHRILMTELSGQMTCLYTDGTLKIYGSYSANTTFEFTATYLS